MTLPALSSKVIGAARALATLVRKITIQLMRAIDREGFDSGYNSYKRP